MGWVRENIERDMIIRFPITRRDLAMDLGLHPVTLATWEKMGLQVLPRRRIGRNSEVVYDLIHVRQWMTEKGREGRTRVLGDEKRGKLGQDPDSFSKPEADLHLVLQKIRSQRANADRVELEVQLRRGQLLEREDVEEGRAERIAAVKAVMFSMPAKVAPEILGRDQRTVQRVLEEWARRACEEFARPANG